MHSTRSTTRSTIGRLDLVRHPDHVEVLMDVPGVLPEDLEVIATGDRLTVRGARRDPRGGDAAGHRFERTVRLARDLAPDRVEARLDRGVLRIVVPHAGSRRRIPIEPANVRSHRGSSRVRRGAPPAARRLRTRAREVLHRRRRPVDAPAA